MVQSDMVMAAVFMLTNLDVPRLIAHAKGVGVGVAYIDVAESYQSLVLGSL